MATIPTTSNPSEAQRIATTASLFAEAFGPEWVRIPGDTRSFAEILADEFGEEEFAEMLAGAEYGSPEWRGALRWIRKQYAE